MKAIGLDIGTTTICGVALDAGSGAALDAETLPNDSGLRSSDPLERAQDPGRILTMCESLLSALLARHPDAAAIGVSAQMHGMLYLDARGAPRGPLCTWQDARGDRPGPDGRGYAQALSELTGYGMASGYALTTHYVLSQTGGVPKDASALCTIGDYVAMALSGRLAPIIHPSMAASLGLFDVEAGGFDARALGLAGLDGSILPEANGDEHPIGTHRGIPVAPALGDNQASFLGSAGAGGRALVNVGTGGQISILTDSRAPVAGLELRPYVGGQRLLVGSTLCAGYAYQLVRDFFHQTAAMMGFEPPDDLYERMNSAALAAMDAKNPPLFDTRFSGTRLGPSIRASLSGLGRDSLTPGLLALSALRGIAGELYEYFARSGADKPEFLVASGNGIRKNPLLRRVFEQTFGLPVRVPLGGEEAATGAALFSLASAGALTLAQAQSLVRHE